MREIIQYPMVNNEISKQDSAQDGAQVSVQDGAQVDAQDGAQVTTQDKINMTLEFCFVPRTRDEMQQYIGITSREYFRKNILKPLLASEQLKMTIPGKPNSKNQKYVKA